MCDGRCGATIAAVVRHQPVIYYEVLTAPLFRRPHQQVREYKKKKKTRKSRKSHALCRMAFKGGIQGFSIAPHGVKFSICITISRDIFAGVFFYPLAASVPV